MISKGNINIFASGARRRRQRNGCDRGVGR